MGKYNYELGGEDRYKTEIYEDHAEDEKIANKIDDEMLAKELNNPAKERIINECAIRWSELNNETKNGNSSKSILKEMEKLRKKIMVEVFSLYQKSYKRTTERYVGKDIDDFIIINSKGDKISSMKFYKFLDNSVNVNSSSCYDAEKNDNYVAYFRKIIKLRSKESKKEIKIKKEKEEKIKTVPLYAMNEDGEEYLVTDTKEVSDRYEQHSEEGYIKLLVPAMRLCEIFIRNRKDSENKKVKWWLFFRVQYTFEIIKEIERIKTCYIPPPKLKRTEINSSENITPQELEVYCDRNEEFYLLKKKNHEIYRNMRLVMVKILKEGNIEDFSDMFDITRRCLRIGIDLEKGKEKYVEEGVAKDDEYPGDTFSKYKYDNCMKIYRSAIEYALKSRLLTY